MTLNGAVSFPQFDVVSDHSDHAYAVEKATQKPYDASVYRTITKEWRILADNLPDSIFVRVYDTRVYLLRAAIIGASGTPYHDALFFFDVKFPPEYPALPPLVHYRSFGLRVNPNLYANGKVCLSLLNTWTGKKREKWDPKQSTVLQVLLSIQALVLNEKPYFNEPGTGSPGASGQEKKSRAYSEDAFVLTCKTTLFNLRDPPRNFEAFTAAHYRVRASRILGACGAYLNSRVGVGYYNEDADVAEARAVWEVSKNFKASVKEVLYPQIVMAFMRIGCVGLVEEVKTTPVKVEVNKTTSGKVKGEKAVKIGIVKKVIGKLSKLLGLSNKKKNV